MKNVFLVFGILFVFSCTYNSEEELGIIIPGDITIEEQVIGFQATVRPIIDENCAIKDCHAAGATDQPDFSVDLVVEAYSSSIKEEVLSGRMPREGTLTFQEKDSLISWVNQGAILD